MNLLGISSIFIVTYIGRKYFADGFRVDILEYCSNPWREERTSCWDAEGFDLYGFSVKTYTSYGNH